jgi:putative ABC transport system permease protein
MPAESIPGLSVTPGLFTMFGVAPLKGRLFDSTRDVSSQRALAVIISHRLWQQRFGGASDILDRHVRIDGISRRIIGVMPPDFRYLSDNVDCWLPMILLPNAARQPGAGRWFVVAARLKPGVTIARAQADVDAVAANLARESPERHKGWGVRVQSLRDALYGWTKAPLLTLQAAVSLLLLIACTNVAGLFLARGTVRRREIALRTALGAGRGRIVRQLLAESVLLSAAGGLLGLLVAWCALVALATLLGPPPGAPRIGTMSLDLRILAVTVLLSLLSALAFGLAPALATGKLDLTSALSASAPASGTHPSGHRRRSLLVAAQIAVALVLLVAAGLLSKSFVRLAGREINMDTKGLLTFEYSIPSAAYAKQIGYVRVDPHFEINAPPSGMIHRVFDRLRQLPGTISVAGISYPPVNSLVLPTANVVLLDSGDEHPHQVAYFLVTANFFSTVRTPLVRGRDFDTRDTSSSPWVAVVNESMARRFWPGEQAIGKRLRLGNGPDERDREVIGVVRDIPTRSKQIEAEPVIYASYLQQPSRYAGGWIGMFGQMTFVVRHAGDSVAVLSSARRAVSEIDPNRPIVSVGTIERHLTALRRESRNYVLAFAVFALTATLLTAIGLYGVTAHAVSERTREIGIRRALGAGKWEIVTLVGRRMLTPILAGLIFGLAGALAFTRLIATQLWDVTQTDPATYVAMSLLLASVALLACLAPTRRALAVDPTVVLRCE